MGFLVISAAIDRKRARLLWLSAYCFVLVLITFLVSCGDNIKLFVVTNDTTDQIRVRTDVVGANTQLPAVTWPDNEPVAELGCGPIMGGESFDCGIFGFDVSESAKPGRTLMVTVFPNTDPPEIMFQRLISWEDLKKEPFVITASSFVE